MDGARKIKKRKEVRQTVKSLLEKAQTVAVIHYSCESFYDKNQASSPRITSIACRRLIDGQTHSFSIHLTAERDKKIKRDEIDASYDKLEKKMLEEFFDFAKNGNVSSWVHWNMRDTNYGFKAIEHRARVLGFEPYAIPDAMKIDFARELIDYYGKGYSAHPRLPSLIGLNKISPKDMLTGEDEALSFTNGEYKKLHLSTLRKVDVIHNLFELFCNGELKTLSKKQEMCGGYFWLLIEWVREHWLASAICFLSAIIGLGTGVWQITLWLKGGK